MAKDDRRIHSGVRLDGTTYVTGMEDELAAICDKEQINYLLDQGAISGNWGQSVKAETAATPPTKKGK
jgi:hypothetical protein